MKIKKYELIENLSKHMEILPSELSDYIHYIAIGTSDVFHLCFIEESYGDYQIITLNSSDEVLTQNSQIFLKKWYIHSSPHEDIGLFYEATNTFFNLVTLLNLNIEYGRRNKARFDKDLYEEKINSMMGIIRAYIALNVKE